MLSALYKFTVNECVQVCVFGPHKVSEGYDTIVHWTQRSNKNAGKYKITVVYPRQCSRLRHGHSILRDAVFQYFRVRFCDLLGSFAALVEPILLSA